MIQIIIINGISATGKTTIGKQIAERIGLPFFTKDAIKERLFDELGYSDRAWAHRLSAATHVALNYVIEEELKVGRGFVLESNFNPEFDIPKFKRWQEQFELAIVQVLCHADGQVVFERFQRRIESGERHPGHADHLNVEAFRAYLMQGRCAPLDVDSRVIEVDTTDFESVDIGEIVRQIQT